MRYREQALEKIARVENTLKRLEGTVNRGGKVVELEALVNELKERNEQLRELISLEHPTWDAKFGS